MTCSVDVFASFPVTPVLTQWLQKLNGYGSKDGGDVWAQQHGLTHQSWCVYSHCWMLNLPTAESNRATDVGLGSLQLKKKKKKEAALSPDWNRHLLWINMCLLCPQCFCRNHHLWTYRMSYSTFWYFTHKHYFWSVSLFYSKYNNRLMLGEFTDLIIFPIILKLLGDKMEWLLKIQ